MIKLSNKIVSLIFGPPINEITDPKGNPVTPGDEVYASVKNNHQVETFIVERLTTTQAWIYNRYTPTEIVNITNIWSKKALGATKYVYLLKPGDKVFFAPQKYLTQIFTVKETLPQNQIVIHNNVTEKVIKNMPLLKIMKKKTF